MDGIIMIVMKDESMGISNYLLEVEVNGEISENVPVRLEGVSRNFAVGEAVSICKMEGQNTSCPAVKVNIICEKSGVEQLVK